jgi:trimeric autotransporter adhesin
VGYSALTANTTGANNTTVGHISLQANTTGAQNTAIGRNSLNANTTASNNTAVGHSALAANTTAESNTAVGKDALVANTTADNNTAVGYQAGYSNTTGTENVYIGQVAGYTNSTGDNNTFIGRYAGYSTTGGDNTFVGRASGNAITSGTKNTIIGRYDGNTGGLDIRTASNHIVLSDGDGNPRGIFDSSGNLLVGKTASNFTVAGHEIKPGGFAGFTRDGGSPIVANRLTNDGDIVEFYKGVSSVGSIGTGNSGNLYIGSGDAGINFNKDVNAIYPINAGTGGGSNGVLDLGYGGIAFKDLYLSGGVYLGGTGSANHLDDYETGTWTPTVGGTWTTDPTSLSGTYIKVGSLVYVKVNFSGGAKSSAAAGWIDGLPFNQVGGGATGSVSDSNVGDKGNCLFANTTRIWLTDTSFSTTNYLSGSYNTDA